MVPVQLQPPGPAQPPTAMAARRDFWPSSGDWVGSEIARGDHFAPDHPLVAAFPSLFERVAVADPYTVRVYAPALAQVVAPVAAASLPAGWDDDLRAAIRWLGERSDRGAAVVYPPSVTFAEGAFQLTMPGTTIAEGAVRVDVTTPDVSVPVSVAPAEVTIAEGAIRVDVTTPDVNVTTPDVTFAEGSIRVDVTAEPDVINVTTPDVTFAEGSIRVDVTTPVLAAESLAGASPLTRMVVDRDPETNVITGAHEEPVATRTVIDRDIDGAITGSHEEPL
jgi:hypothetical protein